MADFRIEVSTNFARSSNGKSIPFAFLGAAPFLAAVVVNVGSGGAFLAWGLGDATAGDACFVAFLTVLVDFFVGLAAGFSADFDAAGEVAIALFFAVAVLLTGVLVFLAGVDFFAAGAGVGTVSWVAVWGLATTVLDLGVGADTFATGWAFGLEVGTFFAGTVFGFANPI